VHVLRILDAPPPSIQVLVLILDTFGGVFVRDGQCPEYSGEEQAICAVGLAKCKPGIFVEAIQYLVVLATPAEVIEYCSQSSCVIHAVSVNSDFSIA